MLVKTLLSLDLLSIYHLSMSKDVNNVYVLESGKLIELSNKLGLVTFLHIIPLICNKGQLLLTLYFSVG